MVRAITRFRSQFIAPTRSRTLALPWAMVAALSLAADALALDFASWSERETAVRELVNEQRAHHGLDPLLADSRLHNAARAHSQDMLSRDFFSHTNPDGVRPAARGTAAGYDWRSFGENIAAGAGREFSGGRIVETPPVDAARSVMYGTSNLTTVRNFVRDNGLGDANSFGWDDIGDAWSNATWDAWHQSLNGSGGWMGSAGHRANILASNYTDLGVGYVFSANDTGSTNYETYWTQNFASGDSRPPSDPHDPFDARKALAPILKLLLDSH